MNESIGSSLIGDLVDHKRYNSNEKWQDGFAPDDPKSFLSYEKQCRLNLFTRTSLSLDRVEFDLSGPQQDRQLPERVKLALISSSILGPYRRNVDGQKEEVPGEEIDLASADRGSRKIMRTPAAYNPAAWKKKRLEEFRVALENKADIVCFPEFAYPQPPNRRDRDQYKVRRAYGDHVADFEERIRTEIRDIEDYTEFTAPFICLGSYHCPEDYFNLGVVYPYGAKSENLEGKVIKRSLLDPSVTETAFDETFNTPLLHRKRYPARRMGETARIPNEVEFYTYRRHGLRIAILICSDVVDLNQFMNLIRLNSVRRDNNPIDLILVPSYNNSPIMRSMCRELSFLASTMVAYVNANPTIPDSFPGTEFFTCGQDSEELKDLERAESKVLTVEDFPACDGKSSIKIIDLSTEAVSLLREERRTTIEALNQQTSVKEVPI